MKLWHVSNPCNRESILKNGLLPMIGECYASHYEGRMLGEVIFLSTDENNIFDSTWDDDIFEINIPDKMIMVFEDISMKYPYVYTLDIIAKDFITCKYKGTGKSTF